MAQKKSSLPRELKVRAEAQQANKPFSVTAVDPQGRQVSVRPKPMTLNQLNELRSRNLDPTFWDEKRVVAKLQSVDPEDNAAVTQALIEGLEETDALQRKTIAFWDAVRELLWPGYDFGGNTYPDLIRLSTISFNLTMGRDIEIKNS